MPGERANGDQWLVQERVDAIRVAIVDGLGHGPEAEAASLAAIDDLAAAPDLGPVEALVRCDRALRGTRGAAASVLVIEPARQRLTFAGVGNVEGRLVGADGQRHFSPGRGIVGRGIRVPHLLELPLDGDWAVLLYSDGIKTPEAMFIRSREAIERSAEAILRTSARPTDDATIVVVRGGPLGSDRQADA